MEQQQIFAVFYGRTFVCKIYAHSKFEAIERVYSRVVQVRPDMERQKYCAKVVNV